MFMKTPMTPDKVLQVIIESYFENVRAYCKQELNNDNLASVEQAGNMMLHSMVGAIIEMAEPDKQVELFEQIQHRFMFVLRDYDREWVWDLLGTFSKNLPEQMLH